MVKLEEFNKVYRYKKDIDKFGFNEVWELPSIDKDGFIYGDCESYCIYLKNHLEYFNDWDYYYCKLNGNGHCVLYKNGDIIDCNTKRVVTTELYYKMFIVTEFKKYNWIIVQTKLLVGKLKSFLFKEVYRGRVG